MQTQLADFIKDTDRGREAASILRSCVHCGFCTATCPTYQLVGDELDGPRGRIYLLKQLLEGQPATRTTQRHLDRCLTCRSCETTCPSGVNYHRLADIGRGVLAERLTRPLGERLLRRGLRAVLPYRRRFTPLLRAGQLARRLLPLPAKLKNKIPEQRAAGPWPLREQSRKVLILDGCVQPGIAPNINAATARVLDRLGMQVLRTAAAGCCGAVSYHLDEHAEGLDFMRRNIDAWWPQIEAGAEAIVITASGCGSTVKEYGHLLAADPDYAERAAKVSALARDIVELITEQDLDRLNVTPTEALVFQSPCSLQHGQKLNGAVETLLTRAGFTLLPVADPHLCCGSAGTYSILQPELSLRLRDNKLAALQSAKPALIATANIGCLAHLQSGTELPVRHWIEVLDDACL